MARGGWGFDCSLPVAIFDRWLIGSGGRRRGLICIHECESVAPASWSGGGGGGGGKRVVEDGDSITNE